MSVYLKKTALLFHDTCFVFLGLTGPCRQMCVVKVTRVESDLLAHSTSQVKDASPERLSTSPLTSTSSQSNPDPGHASSQTSVDLDEGRVTTNTVSTAKPGSEPTSESDILVDVTLDSERTAESPNQTDCESVSGISAPSVPVTHSQRRSSTGAAVLFWKVIPNRLKLKWKRRSPISCLRAASITAHQHFTRSKARSVYTLLFRIQKPWRTEQTLKSRLPLL